MKLTDLRFDTQDNACQSLRILAELVRAGKIVFHAQPVEQIPSRKAEGLSMAFMKFDDPTTYPGIEKFMELMAATRER